MSSRDLDELEPVAATKAKVNFGDILYQASVNGKRFVVNQHGRPVAVIMGFNEYESLMIEKRGD